MPSELVLVETASAYSAHLPAVKTLFESVFCREFPAAIWNLFYFENPFGGPMVAMIYEGSQLAGHEAMVPGIASDGRTDTKYYLSMSTMIHPMHRSMPAFLAMFHGALHMAEAKRGDFVLGFPNEKAYLSQRRCFGFQPVFESRLRNWTPPTRDPAVVSQDPQFGRSRCGFSPLSKPEHWRWRTKLNGARAVTVNGRLRVVYKLLSGGTLNVLSTPVSDRSQAISDLAGLAAAEGCGNVRLTDHHAALFGVGETELHCHENYSIRMTARALCSAVPPLELDLLFCDIF